MMMTWMVWGMMVAVLLGASAHLAEWALRERGHPGRWPWAVALALSWGLPLWAWLFPPSTVDMSSGPGDQGWTVVDPSWLVGLGTPAAVRWPWTSDLVDGVFAALWVVSALVATIALVGGLRGLSRRASTWTRARVEGELVLVSEDFGPALVGVVHPRIVLPAWALSLPSEELRMAYLHEDEHRAAGDARLLFLGALLVSMAPWNPALWWQLGRLRLGVEVDCDGRVLRRGATRRAYGRMLLDLGAGEGPHSLAGLALAKPASLLERRMKMMVRKTRTRGPAYALAASALSAALLVAACDAPPPTNVEEAAPPAGVVLKEIAEPEAASARIRVRGDDGEVTDRVQGTFSFEGARVQVDGEVVEEVPRDLDAGRIERVEVTRLEGGGQATINILTKREPAEPVVYMDGERFEGDVSRLRPESIERVDVLKGDTALERFGSEGAHGVILITTKEAAGTVAPG